MRSSLSSIVTPHRIFILLTMLAILGLVTYYSSLPTTPGIIIDNQTGEQLLTPKTGDTISGITNNDIVPSTVDSNSGLIAATIDNSTDASVVYPSAYLVEITSQSDDSCSATEIQDAKGKKIETSIEVAETLDCIGGAEIISHNYRFLLYTHSSAPDYKTIDLKTYDFSNKKSQTLMSFNNTIDGMSCQRRDDDSYIACVVINQTDYPGSTKVFILQINPDGSLAKKQVFPQSNDTRVGFHCASSCYPSDFRWEGTRTLKYKGQDNGDDILTGKTYSITYE